MYLIIQEKGGFSIMENPNISDWKKCEKALVHFCLCGQNGKAYADYELYDTDGVFIDSCFVMNKKENVNAETDIFEKGGERVAVFELRGYDGTELRITDIRFEKPIGKLFDGEILYQLPHTSALMMGYVMVTKNKKVIVVDGGDTKDGALLTELIKKHGGVVHHWFVTHCHEDHIRAIIDIFQKEAVRVNTLYYSFPDLSILQERGDELAEKFRLAIPPYVKAVTPKKGDRYEIDSVKVCVLNDAWFEKGTNFYNDSSVVYKFETSKNSVLFTGDLGLKGDDYLCENQFKKQIKDCKIVQMSHHGNSGVSKEFYDHTSVEICLYPTPLWLWNNDNGGGKNSSFWTTLITREWMRERNVKKSFPSITKEIITIY